MTNDNYTQMSNIELLEQIKQVNKKPRYLERFLKYHLTDLLNEIIKRTYFLDQFYSTLNGRVPITARLYCIEHNLNEVPKCKNPTCPTHEYVKWNERTQSFCEHCSTRCSSLDPNVQLKNKNTCHKLYGDETFNNPRKAKSTKNEMYGDENYNNREQYVKTCYDRYGVSNTTKLNCVQQKIIQTMINNHGVEYAMQSKSIRDKSKNTCQRKYHCDYVTQTEWFKENFKQICNKKFGVNNPAKSNEIKEKIKKSMIKNHGVEWAMQSKEVLEKSRRTCYILYGVDNYSKTPEFHQKCSKPYTNSKYPEMTFGSSWEFKVYDFLMQHNIEFEYQPNISFEYEYDGKTHTYHPDFKVGDKIIEVKGDHFFRINESTGQEEMYCPFKGDLSDEEYDWLCGLYEEKHKCMVKNNVTILKHCDIDNLSSVDLQNKMICDILQHDC